MHNNIKEWIISKHNNLLIAKECYCITIVFDTKPLVGHPTIDWLIECLKFIVV